MILKLTDRHRRTLRRLGFVARIVHPQSRRHLYGIALAVPIMTAGSLLAMNAHTIGHHSFGATLCLDVLGYMIHGIGTLPIFRHIEPVWSIIIGPE